MIIGIKQLTALAVIITLGVSTPLLAGGDKNANNNPNDAPDEDTFDAPYANVGDGRMMVFCAEDEKLVVTPIDTGAVEVTCVPADD